MSRWFPAHVIINAKVMNWNADEAIKRWTAKRKSALGLDITQGKATIAVASQTHDPSPPEIENRVEDGRRRIENALQAKGRGHARTEPMHRHEHGQHRVLDKSWLARALAQYACRLGHSALYLRVPRLNEELRVLYGNGGFTKWLLQLARVDVLLLHAPRMAPLDAMVRNDLREMFDDRSAGKATIVTSQLPIEHWHGWAGDETIADAMLDRLRQCHHRIALAGESLRKASLKPTSLEPELDQN